MDTQNLAGQILKRNTAHDQVVRTMRIRSGKTKMAIWTRYKIFHETTQSNRNKLANNIKH